MEDVLDVEPNQILLAKFHSQVLWEQMTLPAVGFRLRAAAMYSHEECGALWGPKLVLHIPEDPEVRWAREPVVDVKESARRLYSRSALNRSLQRSVVVSSTVATAEDLVQRHGLTKERIKMIPLGVDVKKFSYRRNQSLGQEFFHLASGDPRDHTELLLEGYAIFVDRMKDIVPGLVIGGELGSARSSLLQRAKALGIGSHMRLLGRITDADLVEHYSTAIASVHPSMDEGFGLQPLEAMACGSLLIACEAPAVQEIVSAGEVLWSDSSPEDMARCLEVAWSGAALRRKAEIRNPLVAEGFSWDKTSDAIHDLLIATAER